MPSPATAGTEGGQTRTSAARGVDAEADALTADPSGEDARTVAADAAISAGEILAGSISASAISAGFAKEAALREAEDAARVRCLLDEMQTSEVEAAAMGGEEGGSGGGAPSVVVLARGRGDPEARVTLASSKVCIQSDCES